MLRKRIQISNDNKISEVRTSHREPEREQRIFSFKASQWIWLFFGVIEVLIALRIGLEIMAANPDSPIVALIYGLTSILASILLIPFAGLTSPLTVGGMLLETSSIFAIGIYALTSLAFEGLV